MKTLIEMAREAGISWFDEPNRLTEIQIIERFAELVRADEQKKWQDQTAVEIHEAIMDEREACAKECERMMMYPNARQESAAHQDVWAAAKAIRARSKDEK